MKFARELERDLVPEWRVKYLDYKVGKKKVKAVAKAVARAQTNSRTPRTPTSNVTSRRPSNVNQVFGDSPFFHAIGHYPNVPADQLSPHNHQQSSARQSPTALRTSPTALRTSPTASRTSPTALRTSPTAVRTSPTALRTSPTALRKPPGLEPYGSSSQQQTKVTTPILIPGKPRNGKQVETSMRYGSFVPTPPTKSKPPHFQLPDPALDSYSEGLSPKAMAPIQERLMSETVASRPIHQSPPTAVPGSAYEVGQTVSPVVRSTFDEQSRQPLPRQKSASVYAAYPKTRLFMRRLSVMSGASMNQSPSYAPDLNLTIYDQVRAKQKEFFEWMDSELEKIEAFYKLKEDEAGERLKVIREQLHEMRNRRIDEMAKAKKEAEDRNSNTSAAVATLRMNGPREFNEISAGNVPGSQDHKRGWVRPYERGMGPGDPQGPRPATNSQAFVAMGPSLTGITPAIHTDPGRDYVRKPQYEQHNVPYRTAKRKLKLALKEFYRGLELLKAYAMLNRTAFRKINKKYDKGVNAHPPLRYMSEKVNKARFVTSDVLEGHLHSVEDLYARYFERGNYKIAIGKLRISHGRPGTYTGSVFRTGILIGVGVVFAAQGLANGTEMLRHNPNLLIRTQASYLLQIYGGYFLALYLFTFFTLNCAVWNRNKVNYVFIFEFDPRNNLNWRQLAEFPAFLIMLFGLILWLNFSGYGTPEMFIYYPVILAFLTALVIFLPAPILFHRSREWFAYSHWRLLLAGLYPVEFRDFFLGDMFCSLTYLMSNVELFFCLYASHWNLPSQCDSTHSKLLGFFTALPGIWRALQCIRRYYDTQSVFPHLANCGKYAMTIMYYTSLSLYRIHQQDGALAIFITFASINAVYCCIWDLVMDWSLLQPQAKHRFLRDVRAYRSVWYYYSAMLVDVILRWNWVFYIIYTHDLQHNSIASFLIAFTEVTRRGVWTLFRVENEHCANVMRFKASRDVPLPYPVSADHSQPFTRPHSEPSSPETLEDTDSIKSGHRGHGKTSAAETGQASQPADTNIRRRLVQVFADAHTHDFEKKRKPATSTEEGGDATGLDRDGSQRVGRNSSDEDEDEEDTGDEDAVHVHHPWDGRRSEDS